MEREREKGLGENETWFKFGKKLLQDPELTKSWNLNFFVKSSRKILHYQQTTTTLVVNFDSTNFCDSGYHLFQHSGSLANHRCCPTYLRIRIIKTSHH